MSNPGFPSFGTDAIHAGQDPAKFNFKSAVPPITMASTYQRSDTGIPDLTNGKYIYSRLGNPTRECLEQCIAKLENAKHGLAFSSGMAAITGCIQTFAKAGDHVICGDDVYGGTNWYFNNIANKNGLEIDMVDMRSIDAVVAAVRDSTQIVFFESMTNPLLRVVDVAAVAEAVHKIRDDIVVIVDNTFMTPWNMRPLDLGADIVVHSATKYINGHSDVVCGLLSTNSSNMREALFMTQITLGAVPSPFDSYLVNRGMKTLHLRMPRHAENAMKVAEWLEANPRIEKVYYPGLPSHPEHDILKKVARGAPGIITFSTKGQEENASKFLKSTKVVTLAVSLGGYESLAEHPASMTHANVPKEHREALGITDTMIRMSVGLEDAEDIIADLENALKIALPDGQF